MIRACSLMYASLRGLFFISLLKQFVIVLRAPALTYFFGECFVSALMQLRRELGRVALVNTTSDITFNFNQIKFNILSQLPSISH